MDLYLKTLLIIAGMLLLTLTYFLVPLVHRAEGAQVRPHEVPHESREVKAAMVDYCTQAIADHVAIGERITGRLAVVCGLY